MRFAIRSPLQPNLFFPLNSGQLTTENSEQNRTELSPDFRTQTLFYSYS